MWIFASACELPLVHLLLPWSTARGVAALVLGAWGLVWMLGLLAGYRMFPHLVDEERIRVRNGPLVDVPLSWSDIVDVRPQERDLPTTLRTVQLEESPVGTVLQIGVSGRTNTLVTLRSATALPTPGGEVVAVSVRFWCDQPRTLSARTKVHWQGV